MGLVAEEDLWGALRAGRTLRRDLGGRLTAKRLVFCTRAGTFAV
jgi:hypothetical protein